MDTQVLVDFFSTQGLALGTLVVMVGGLVVQRKTLRVSERETATRVADLAGIVTRIEREASARAELVQQLEAQKTAALENLLRTNDTFGAISDSQYHGGIVADSQVMELSQHLCLLSAAVIPRLHQLPPDIAEVLSSMSEVIRHNLVCMHAGYRNSESRRAASDAYDRAIEKASQLSHTPALYDQALQQALSSLTASIAEANKVLELELIEPKTRRAAARQRLERACLLLVGGSDAS